MASLSSPRAVLARLARHAAAIVVASAIAMAPMALVALGVQVPANPAQANIVLRIAWLCAASGMAALLVLVGALAPLARGDRVSQVTALGRSVRGLVRALIPAAAVLCATALGLVALAVPGVLLYTLFVLAPASEAGGVSAQLADSVALVRARWQPIAAVLGVTIVALVAVVAVQQWRLPLPLGKTPARAQLVLFPQLVRTTAIAVAVLVPLAAVALVALAGGRERRS